MAEYIEVHFMKFYEHIKTPKRATLFSVGSDLCSAFEYCIPRRGVAAIDTGLGVIPPPGYDTRVAPKSGLAYKHSLHIGGGVVDPDYTGHIYVIIFNHSDNDYLVEQLQPVAQIIFEKVALPIFKEIKCLPATERGDHGLGKLIREETEQALQGKPK